MKKIVSIALLIVAFAAAGYSQTAPAALNPDQRDEVLSTRIGIVISSNDPETVWNAFRFANFSCQKGDSVSVFLLGKGVEAPILKHKYMMLKA
jgi:hypothetical protein